MIQTQSVLPTVIARVAAIAGVPTVILLAGQAKGEHFVISGSDIVTRAPIDGAVNRRPIDHRAPLASSEDISGLRVSAFICPELEPAYMTPLPAANLCVVLAVGSAVCQTSCRGDIRALMHFGLCAVRRYQGVGKMVVLRQQRNSPDHRWRYLDASEQRPARPVCSNNVALSD